MRITAAQIRMLVTVANNRAIQKWVDGPHPTFHMDHQALGWRLMSGDQATNISPRLQTREMYWWLDGFLSAGTWIKG